MSKNLKYIKKKRQIAPRLASGLSRVGIGHGLPEEIKEGLRLIAQRKNKSVSWVLEEVIIDWFRLPKPEYIKPKSEDK